MNASLFLVFGLLAGVSNAFAQTAAPVQPSETYSATEDDEPKPEPGKTQDPVAAETPQAAAGGIPVTGRIFSDVFLPARNIPNNEFRQVSTSVWLEGDPKLGERTWAHFTLTADWFETNSVLSSATLGSNTTQFTNLRAQVREGYVDWALNGWEFRLGKQIIPWGKSDVTNPTDFLTAKDYAFFNPDDEVRRIGSTGLWLNWTPNQGNSPLSFTGVWTPTFPRSRLLIPSNAVPAGVTFAQDPRLPDFTLPNSEVALKASYAAASWDFSLVGFRGWNHFPEFEAVGVALGQTHHRLTAAGADASFTSGNWIYRLESAYRWTENDDASDMRLIPTHWDSVVGVERPIGNDFRVQLQGLWRYFPRFNGPAILPGADPIARANALLLNYQEKSRPGYTLRLSYAPSGGDWESELFTLGNFVGGDYLIRPKFTYAWSDSLKSTLGVDYYGGPKDRPLGAQKEFNSVFLEGKYTF